MCLWLRFQHQLENAFITKAVTTMCIIVEISLLYKYWEFPQRYHLFLIICLGFLFVCFVLYVFLKNPRQKVWGVGCYALPEYIFRDNCICVMNIADYLSCYIHLTEACNGDARVADILYLSVLGWRGYHIEEFLWFVSTVQCKEDIGCNVAPISFWHAKRFYGNSNVSCKIDKKTLK